MVPRETSETYEMIPTPTGRALAQRACESPAAIAQSRRLAAADALASLVLLLHSVLVLRSVHFSDALAPLLRPAVLDAPLFLALPVP